MFPSNFHIFFKHLLISIFSQNFHFLDRQNFSKLNILVLGCNHVCRRTPKKNHAMQECLQKLNWTWRWSKPDLMYIILGHVWFMDSRNMERKIITFLRLGSTKSGITFLMKGKLGGKLFYSNLMGLIFPCQFPALITKFLDNNTPVQTCYCQN